MDNSATPDLAAMSREELEELLKKQQELIEEQKQTIKEREAAASKDKLKFHKKITKIKTDLAAEKSQNKKLKEANSNLTVIYENLIVYIRENRLDSMSIFEDENIPSKYEYAKLNDFLTSIASSLINTVITLHEAQLTALNLGKSEKNKGEEAPATDDIELEKYGKEENAREAEIREGLEQDDIVYDSDEESNSPPAGSTPDNPNSITSDTEDKVKIYAQINMLRHLRIMTVCTAVCILQMKKIYWINLKTAPRPYMICMTVTTRMKAWLKDDLKPIMSVPQIPMR